MRRLLTLFLIFVAAAAARPAISATLDIYGDLAGETLVYPADGRESVADIARKFDVGGPQLAMANRGTAPAPPAGTMLFIPGRHVLPAQRQGIVINLSELRLYYFREDGTVFTAPIGAGRRGWETPAGGTKVARKRKNPAWTPPASIRAEDPKLPAVVPPGPHNPLGAFALDLALPGYAIHGTNAPRSIGHYASHGCIRLYPEDIETLFGLVPAGTPVTLLRAPIKLGWSDGILFIEAHGDRNTIAAAQGDAEAQLTVYERAGAEIDRAAVREELAEPSGMPRAVGTRHPLRVGRNFD